MTHDHDNSASETFKTFHISLWGKGDWVIGWPVTSDHGNSSLKSRHVQKTFSDFLRATFPCTQTPCRWNIANIYQRERATVGKDMLEKAENKKYYFILTTGLSKTKVRRNWLQHLKMPSNHSNTIGLPCQISKSCHFGLLRNRAFFTLQWPKKKHFWVAESFGG